MYSSSLLSREVSRLRKFFALVKNEYIKLMSTSGAKAMLILLVLAAIAIPGLGKVVSIANQSSFSSTDLVARSINRYNSGIEQEKLEKYDGWEKRIEFYQYLIDNSIADSNWRYPIVEQLYAMEYLYSAAYDKTETGQQTDKYSEEEYKQRCETAYGSLTEKIRTAVKNDDSIEYCRIMLDYNKELLKDSTLSAAEKEAELESKNFPFQYRVDNNYPIDSSWKSELIEAYCAQKAAGEAELAKKKNNEAYDEKALDEATKNAEISRYRIENDIEINLNGTTTWSSMEGEDAFTVWTLWCSTTGMVGESTMDSIMSIISIIGVFTAVMAGIIVASEFSEGTIKFLLINPTKRWKIITAKYVTIISIGFAMLLIAYIISGIASLCFMGTGNGTAAFIEYDGSGITALSGPLYIARRYLIGSVTIIAYGSLAFAVSSLMQSAALSVGISLFCMMGGGIVNLVMQAAGFDWGRFLIFANTNLNSIVDGSPMYYGQTTLFALGVIAVHLTVFLMIAWDGFTRKEV